MSNDYAMIRTADALIATGASLSAPVRLDGYGITRITIPTVWNAANLTFQVGLSETGNFADLYDSDGNEIVVTAAANRTIVLLPRIFGTGFYFIKVRSGTGLTPVPQTADRNLRIIARPL